MSPVGFMLSRARASLKANALGPNNAARTPPHGSPPEARQEEAAWSEQQVDSENACSGCRPTRTSRLLVAGLGAERSASRSRQLQPGIEIRAQLSGVCDARDAGEMNGQRFTFHARHGVHTPEVLAEGVEPGSGR